MCNLYSVTKGQSAIRDLFSVKHDRAGNLPPLPAVFPDQMAPVVRTGADGERELVMARWGMPGTPLLRAEPNLKSPLLCPRKPPGWRLPRTPEQASWRPLQSQAGNGILTAETLRALRAGSRPKASVSTRERGASRCRRDNAGSLDRRRSFSPRVPTIPD